MAGVGVLALPNSMVGTGPAGFALLIYFTLNAMFSGSRLGLCWVMICERWEEYREGVRTHKMNLKKIKNASLKAKFSPESR